MSVREGDRRVTQRLVVHLSFPRRPSFQDDVYPFHSLVGKVLTLHPSTEPEFRIRHFTPLPSTRFGEDSSQGKVPVAGSGSVTTHDGRPPVSLRVHVRTSGGRDSQKRDPSRPTPTSQPHQRSGVVDTKLREGEPVHQLTLVGLTTGRVRPSGPVSPGLPGGTWGRLEGREAGGSSRPIGRTP